ncbi:M28 family peptidase [Balneola vulgaris]|uniref:M28 family peptidase n=1 Tax=Balneola vulgaris TaxID=287535 RepID=UPI00036F9C05|nr:M28 family peptidase [Balneola vulgaris]
MNKNLLYLLPLGIFLLTTCSKKNTSPHHPIIEPYFTIIDQEFDESQALQTVAYVEQFFRVVGNEGFNKSIFYVEKELQSAGFVNEDVAEEDDRLTYRIEERPLERQTWEPVGASLSLEDGTEILNFETNRNMIAINSYSTGNPETYEVVNVGSGRELNFDQDIKGKVVFGETSVRYLFNEAVLKRGAAGVLAYRMPSYTNPEVNQTSIQFSGITLDEQSRSFGILLSYAAKEALLKSIENGDDQITVDITTNIYPSTELTVVAELKGSTHPDDRFVFSAHVQEPGANDNASGVGALTEVALTSARLFADGKINPERTITYLFGDEIISTRRFIEEDSVRAETIKWGMSLDMVGEDTEKTGGSFLIEKMPDPGAIWVRGNEKHTEWGGRILSKEDMMPHYFNDFVLNRFIEQGQAKNWTVNVNPYEGGSDHVPFLRNDIPGLLLWHFTDQFYHTDNDRIDKVSPQTLKNVGTGALITALTLTGSQEEAFNLVLSEIKEAALNRLNVEFELSKDELSNNGSIAEEKDILSTWSTWYQDSAERTIDILSNPSSAQIQQISEVVTAIQNEEQQLLNALEN